MSHVDDTASSRSSSPASDDIDMEGAPVTSRASQSQQQQKFNAPLSPVSPQKNGSALPPGVNTAGPRVPGPSKQAGSQGGRSAQQGNKKRHGHSKHEASGSGYSRGPAGLMDPAQGSAYERLLDLNYPRGQYTRQMVRFRTMLM